MQFKILEKNEHYSIKRALLSYNQHINITEVMDSYGLITDPILILILKTDDKHLLQPKYLLFVSALGIYLLIVVLSVHNK